LRAFRTGARFGQIKALGILLKGKFKRMKTTLLNSHNLVPGRFEPRTIAIIGGKGAMGFRLAQEFFKEGYEVRLTGEAPLNEYGPTKPKDWGRAIRKWNENVCRGADVIVFAVPIPVLSEAKGLKDIFGHMPPRGWRNKLVIDICSTKRGPLLALKGLKGASVIGTHPMFGPKVKSLTGQTMFVCPVEPDGDYPVLKARLEVRLKWLKEFWERKGVKVVQIDPKEHDAFVPAVQFGVLLSVLLYGGCLRNAGISLRRVQDNGTPNSRILCTRLARMLSSNMLPTYVNLSFDNPDNLKWMDSALAFLTHLKLCLANNDRNAFLACLQEVARYQPADFQKHFTDESVFVDECFANKDALIEWLAGRSELGQKQESEDYARSKNAAAA
jgi:prephenate dehydrogenase